MSRWFPTTKQVYVEFANGNLSSISHKYLALPLIPVEEFLAVFPEHKDSDAHELMIARINHEHAEREKLEQARQELLKRKQALIAENNKRKEDLANLDQDLERFIDVCSPPQLIGLLSDGQRLQLLTRPCFLGRKTNPEDLRERVLRLKNFCGVFGRLSLNLIGCIRRLG
jgi:hypothetical protein